MDDKEFYDPYASQRKKANNNNNKKFNFQSMIEESKTNLKSNENVKELRMNLLLNFFKENNRFEKMKSRIKNTHNITQMIEQNYKIIFGIKHLVSKNNKLTDKNFFSLKILKTILSNFKNISESFKTKSIIFNFKSQINSDLFKKVLQSLQVRETRNLKYARVSDSRILEVIVVQRVPNP